MAGTHVHVVLANEQGRLSVCVSVVGIGGFGESRGKPEV